MRRHEFGNAVPWTSASSAIWSVSPSEKHFARAAEACGVAQPTLSAGLRHLEDDLGVPVVERGNRFKGLTPEGERVLAWAQRILADCHSLEQELVGARKSLTGRINIGVIPSALTMVAKLTAALLAATARPGRQAALAELDRDPARPRRFRAACRHHLSRQRAAVPRPQPAALSRALRAPGGTGSGPGRPYRHRLGRSRRAAAVPAGAGDAEPPHRRRRFRRSSG